MVVHIKNKKTSENFSLVFFITVFDTRTTFVLYSYMPSSADKSRFIISKATNAIQINNPFFLSLKDSYHQKNSATLYGIF